MCIYINTYSKENRKREKTRGFYGPEPVNAVRA